MEDARLPSVVTSEEQLSNRPDGEVPVDHERIKYVTRALGSQQGLYTVLMGAIFLLTELADTWRGPRGWLAALAMLAGLSIFLTAYMRWIPRYYQRRFGHVEPQQPNAKQFAIFLGVIVALIFFGWFFAHRIDTVISSFADRLHMMISDPAHQINLWPSLFWMACVVSSLRWNLRTIERQRLGFFLCGMLGFASIALFAMWHPDARQASLWRVLNAGGIGLSFIAVGLYDHMALVLLLPKSVVESDNE
jgi:hypothetical protein